MFGVVHVCAPDGFFGKVVGHAAMARRNNLEIYEEVYRFSGRVFFTLAYDFSV